MDVPVYETSRCVLLPFDMTNLTSADGSGRAVYGSHVETVGSTPTGGMDVCPL